MNLEEIQMIANARAAYKRHEIDRWQLWDIYLIAETGDHRDTALHVVIGRCETKS